MKRKIGIGIIVILVIIQFIRPSKNEGETGGNASIINVVQVPEEIQKILKTSCYDCHSNSTVYPWYDNIQPVGWWMANHIKEAKSKLNFDEFYYYMPDKAKKKLHGIVKEVEENEMPLKSYLLIHTNSRLSDDQKQKVIAWAKGAQSKIK